MQSFAISNDKLYISQKQGNNAGAYISRMGLYGVKNIEGDKGQYLGGSYAILNNYGHVNNIDIE
ncbi:MAG: hypothetical protein IKV87_08260, partial [Methanobrevibacter sp.]|nr:hypothetical protein [Methanobrevibacter sp.]